MTGWRITLFTLVFSIILFCTSPEDSNNTARDPIEIGRMTLTSSDSDLVKAFQWAKQQALAYVFEGDPVGNWYEAALPGREAFCMRDVSHQSMGAAALGLQYHTRNMLMSFAANISESKDWCTYWEINRHNQPAPVDYRNDEEFWYNLPANFDVLDACWRQYLWTGDRSYVEDPVFLNFYDRTVHDYVDRWDLSLDKIMHRAKNMNLSVSLELDNYYRTCRGLPSYHESDYNVLVGVDLLAIQSAGYRAYANIQNARDNHEIARLFQNRADSVKSFINDHWWDAETHSYYSAYMGDGVFKKSQGNRALLYYHAADYGEKSDALLNHIIKQGNNINIENRSHDPEILFHYGRHKDAYQTLIYLTKKDTKRREYPEVSFAVIGAIVNGLMGIQPNAVRNAIFTLPRFSKETDWVEIGNLSVLSHEISVKHTGLTKTELINNSDQTLNWVAQFPGEYAALNIDGKFRKAHHKLQNGVSCSYIEVEVPPATSRAVQTK